MRRLERDIFPWIGAKPINGLHAPEILTVLHRIEARGAVETAHRALNDCGQVFRYACGRATSLLAAIDGGRGSLARLV